VLRRLFEIEGGAHPALGLATSRASSRWKLSGTAGYKSVAAAEDGRAPQFEDSVICPANKKAGLETSPAWIEIWKRVTA